MLYVLYISINKNKIIKVFAAEGSFNDLSKDLLM